MSQVSGSGRGRWTSWSGRDSCEYSNKYYPSSESEIVDVVNMARGKGLKVRVVGSGHSFNDLACVPDGGVLISLDKYDKLLHVDRERHIVRIEGGMRLHVFHDTLAAHGLSLPNMGVIAAQSVAGVVSTGTHGSGVNHKNISSAVLGCRLVLSSGDILDINDSENSDMLDAVRVSLGALGILTELTIKVVPAFTLRAVERPMPMKDCLRDLSKLREKNEYFKFWWFPHTGMVQAFEISRVPENEAREARQITASGTGSAVKDWLEQRLIGWHLTQAMFYATHKWKKLTPLVNGSLRRMLYYGRESVGRSDHILCNRQHGDEDKGLRMNVNEVAIPIESVSDALRALTREFKKESLYIHWPADIRFIGKDTAWLSPAYNRDSCYIGICTRKPYGKEDSAFLQAFKKFEEIMKKFQARPHWGKLHGWASSELRELYPKWDSFVELRERLDPVGMFVNPHMARIFNLAGDVQFRSRL